MRNIAIWHCYDYGKNDTYILLAESEDALRTKVRESISALWDADDQGPMPEDFDALLEAYEEYWGNTCYFGDWGYTVLDSTLCEPVEVLE
jgi:alpha-L-fucosidase